MEIVKSIETIRKEGRNWYARVIEQRVIHGWRAPPKKAVKFIVDAAFFSQ